MSRRPFLPASQSWRRFFLAYAISKGGDEFTRIALMAKSYAVGGNLSSVAAIAIAQAIPGLLVSPLAGALADRGQKKTLMLVSDLARCLLLAGIALCDSLWLLFVLAALLSTFTTIFNPASGSWEPELVPEEDLARANALRTTTGNILEIAGPALAGLTIAAFDLRVVFLVDALTYLVSFVFVLAIPAPAPRAAGDRDTGSGALTGELRQGIGFVFGHPGLRTLLLAFAAVTLLMGMQGPLLYTFVETQLQAGGETFGLLMACLGAGALAGGVMLERMPTLVERGLLLLATVLFLDAGALFALTLGTSVWYAGACMACMGLISAAFSTIVRYQLQVLPAPGMRGRVFGVFIGVDGPLSVLSLSFAAGMGALWTAAGILRGAAVAEALVAITTLLMLRAAAHRNPARAAGDRGTPG